MLKSLDLFGFKSFADRTWFDFDPGVTGVVGPNGSGKSNVVDAIKWILGVQSAKSLRGKSMADVIFNGSSSRKPSSLAEATLTFDNASGFLPLESQEVQVGRRLYRSGDSEYLINGEAVRLKDVIKLFMGTGAGSAAYCIIEQGRVDQILQANATNRRKVFEEAAGISRFKADKDEAERKLARVEQNLLRLTDIVDEVESQLSSLRGQAAKATKYRDVTERLRTAWLGLAADDYRFLSSGLEDIEQTATSQDAQIEQINEDHRGIEHRLAALDVEVSRVDDHLREVDRQAADNREAIAGHDSTIHHQQDRIHDSANELVRLRRQRTTLSARAREGLAEHDRLQKQLQQQESEFRELTSGLTERDSAAEKLVGTLAEQRQAIETRRADMLEQVREATELASRVSGLESQREAAQATVRQTTEKRTQLESRIATARSDWERRKQDVQEATTRLEMVEKEVSETRGRRKDYVDQLDESQRLLAEQREERSAWLARKAVLEDLESRQEGLGIGVREILSRAKTSDYPPWNRVFGSVADLFDVDLEHAALVEVALGNRAQLIVVEELDSLVDYLQSGTSRISGRVGFVVYSIDRAVSDSATQNDGNDGSAGEDSSQNMADGRSFEQFVIDPNSLPDLTNHTGVQQRADFLVRSPESIPRLAEQLLCDTWIVDSLPTALSLSASEGRGCRFVTLQGELLEADGTLFAGTVRSETALVSRKSELRRLKTDLGRLERRIVEEERRCSNVSESLDGLDQELQAAESEQQQAAARVSERKSTLAGAEQDLERARADRETLDGELVTLTAQCDDLEASITDLQMERAGIEERLEEFRASLESNERETARLEHRVETLRQKVAAERLDSVKSEERLDALRNTFTRVEGDLETRLQQREEAERRCEIELSRRQKLSLQILNARAAVAELFLIGETFERKTQLLSAERLLVREQRSELVAQETALRTRRRELKESQHHYEIDVRDRKQRVEALEKRIEEEFQLVLADVVASGVSAFEAYLSEQATPSESDTTGNQVDVVASDAESESESEFANTADELPSVRFEDVRDELEERVNRLRRKVKSMGNVGADSLRNLDELEGRFSNLNTHLEDLVHAKSELEEIVRRINVECRRKFAESFESIRGHFQELFRKLFGGGEGDIILEDPEDVLECGIDIVARPPGKDLRSISLLSGGEKTMTAVAMLLAMFRSSPSPFCILDEVDAALDEANIERFLSVVKDFRETTQFIMITHRKPSMTVTDMLYGVTMEQSGVSKRMTVRFDDIDENGNFTTDGDALGEAA
jgi:chromosome segregation protein